MVKKLPLSQGKFAIVDEDDFDRLNQFKWSYSLMGGQREYALRSTRKHEGPKRTVLLHQEIMGKAPDGLVTDHINGNGLDNRKSNLRFCTQSQNNMNKRKKGTSSKYKGVYFDKSRKKFRSHIVVDGKVMFLGRYDTELEAALAYDEASNRLHGEFANNNGLLDSKP